MESVIYKITNTNTYEFYIGSAVIYKRRVRQHLWHLRNNKHPNKILQNLYNKYGENIFLFEIIEECSIENLIEREQYYIDSLQPHYNLCKVAGSILGLKRSEETKAKMRESRKSYVITEETKQKIANTLKGRKVVYNKTKEELKEIWKLKGERQRGVKRPITENGKKHLDKIHNIVKKKTVLIHKNTNEKLIFNSRTEAANYLNINTRRVSDFLFLKKKNKTDYHITQE